MKKKTFLIITSISGNTLEWYDFALYGYFASILAKLFFPTSNQFNSLMLTFGVFASGFIIRPLGGVLFGHIGDKYGRKKALIISIAAITLPTTLIGFLPDYKAIGLMAPILLTILRLLQGLAVSGELTGSGVFLVESSTDKNRGLYGSLIMCSTYLGLVIGSALGWLVTLFFNTHQIETFAWRIPFLISLLFGIIAFLLRLKCEESPAFLKIVKEKRVIRFPLNKILTHYLLQTVLILMLSSALAVAIYLMIGYLPIFFISTMNLKLGSSMLISFSGLVVLSCLVPFIGIISDRLNKKIILLTGLVLFILSSYWIFSLASSGSLFKAIIAEILIAISLAPIAATLIPIISDVFPTNVRYSGVSIGYNLSMTLFGGTTPLIAMYLVKLLNSSIAPAYYVLLTALLSLVALFLMLFIGNENTIKKGVV